MSMQEAPAINLVFGQPRRISKMKEYPWEDGLGLLPQAHVRINVEDAKHGWLEQLHHQHGWFAVARRKNGQWVSLFSNLRVEQKTPEDPIDFIKI